MEKKVLLTIVSTQKLMEEPPEETRLVTDGTLRATEDGIELSYAETVLTGLVGTKTTFYVQSDRVTLQRSGKVQSKMIFVVGQEDRSLYDMGFGVLMISIFTQKLHSSLTENGGRLVVGYRISIEDEVSGTIEYQIEARLKE